MSIRHLSGFPPIQAIVDESADNVALCAPPCILASIQEMLAPERLWVNFFWAASVRMKMPRLIVVTPAGDEITIEGKSGLSVMETIRYGGVDDLLALCGGSCSCATCHVWVDPVFADKLPPAADEETELLGDSSHRKETSRLSCQLRLTDELDGLRVTVAPAD